RVCRAQATWTTSSMMPSASVSTLRAAKDSSASSSRRTRTNTPRWGSFRPRSARAPAFGTLNVIASTSRRRRAGFWARASSCLKRRITEGLTMRFLYRLLVAAVFAGTALRAGPPFLTGDSDIVEARHLEVIVGWTSERRVGEHLTESPAFEFNYGA